MKIYLLCYATTAALGITAFHQPASSPLLKTLHRESSSCCSSRLRLLRPPPLTTSCSSFALNSSPDATSSRSSTKPADDAHYQLDQKTWMFQNKYPIAYEVAKVVDNDTNNDSVTTVPILLLNGFGVGSFHQHRLMRQLLIEQQQQQQQQQQEQPNNNRQYIIYGIDYLGQGKSWPTNPNDGNSSDEYQLGYSADMWLDQLYSFVQEVILSSSSLESTTTAAEELESSTVSECNVVNNNNNKVHLVGNSVGGYLATILTYRHQHLVSSLTLLNATPVWGLNLPGWDGKLPAPMLPKIIGRQLFDVIRNEDVIKEYLNAAYVNSKAFDGSFVDSFDGWGGDGGSSSCKYDANDDDNNDGGGGGEPSLGVKIRQCTENNGGHAAFASILWSAPASGVSFYDALEQIQEVDVLLLFGADDPWCTQAVGKRMHVTLDKRRSDEARRTTVSTTAAAHRFVTLDNVGHCPNHEAPTAVARVLLPWLNANDSDQRRVVPLGSQTLIKEPWGEVFIREVSIAESNSLGLVDRVVSTMVG